MRLGVRSRDRSKLRKGRDKGKDEDQHQQCPNMRREEGKDRQAGVR